MKCNLCTILFFLSLKTSLMSGDKDWDDDDDDGLPVPSYRHMGCFNDKRSTRAMDDNIGQWDNKIAITKCATQSWKKGYKVFGIQYGGECWSSKNASFTYDMYGMSTKCTGGTGGSWSNDVYAFINSCPPGFISSNILRNGCQACPKDTYEDSVNGSCKECPNQAKTWGKQGVARSAGCSVENPIIVPQVGVNISSGINQGIITTFNASYKNESLVIPPLVYTITSITRRKENLNEEVILGPFKSCSEPFSQPFCIYKHNGNIVANTNNLYCMAGERLVIKINVSDSANTSSGIIWNSNASVTVFCNDACKGSHRLYERARHACMQTLTNYTVSNNGSTQLDVDSGNINAIYRIYLYRENGKALKDKCSFTIIYELQLKRFINIISISRDIEFMEFKENQSVAQLDIPEGEIVLQNSPKVFTMSCKCESTGLNLSSITRVTFTTLPRRHENCKELKETCFSSVAAWNNSVKGLPGCQKDPLQLWQRYGHCIGQPYISLQPPVWRGPSESRSVRFYCNVTNSVTVKITWFRGHFNATWIVGSGSFLSLTAHPYNQSYYWCEAANAIGSIKKNVLLVTTDYFTSVVQFKLERKRGFNIIKDFCENTCGTILKDNKYLFGPCRHWNQKDKLVVECTFYGKKNGLDINTYYQNLRTDLKEEDVEDLLGGTVTVKDAELCLGESTGRENLQGILTWEPTKIGISNSSPCPLGPQANNATRKCNGSFITGATWEEPNATSCNFKSQNTQSLNKLKKIKVDNKNAEEVAQNLAKVFKTSSPKDFTDEDCSLAADVVSNIVSIGDKLNETAGLVLEVIDTIMDMNETILSKSQGAATKIIDALDKIAKNIPMDNNKTSKVLITGNLVLQANQVSKSSFQGIGFGIKEDRSVAPRVNESAISVRLPLSILARSNQASSRIGFIYYDNNKLFQSELKGNGTKLSKHVISSSVYDTITSNLLEPVRLRIPRLKGQDEESLGNMSCVYWNQKDRKWLDNGCTLCSDQDTDDDSVQCCCSHLTNFAVLFSPQPSVSNTDSTHAKILSIISYVGCAISLVGVVLTFMTYSLFRHLRKTNQQPILMNLCASIGLLLTVFLAGVNLTDNRLACQIVAVLLHYLTLVIVLWMGIEAYNLYLQIVKVMAIYKRKFMLKAALVGWGVPLVIVMATLAAAIIQYKHNDGNMTFYYGNDHVCILHNYLYRLVGWFGPVLAMLLINLVLFVMVIRKLHSTGAMVPVATKSAQRRRCWTGFAIMFLLGLTWLFGALAIADARIFFEYLFCIFNSLQGFFIFFFHCVRIQEVRKQWRFFASGLGFSHRESQQSYPRTRGNGESQSSQRVRVKSWKPQEIDVVVVPIPRKQTILTTVGDSDDIGVFSDEDLKKINIQLDDVQPNSHSTFGKLKDKPC